MRQKLKRLALVSAAGVALVSGSLIAVTGVGVIGATTASCTTAHDDPWPAYTQGMPAGIDPHTAAGVYQWHDSNGWHIRVTHHTDSLRTFSGQLILPKGTFATVSPMRLEPSDSYVVSQDKHTATFLFLNYGYIDGLNFTTHCATSIRFAYQSDGKTLPASKIIIGKSSVHPASDPFTISRVPPPTTTTSSTSTTTTTVAPPPT